MPRQNDYDVVATCRKLAAITDPMQRRRAFERVPRAYRDGVGLVVNRLLQRRQRRMHGNG